jgi:hypothetical protein
MTAAVMQAPKVLQFLNFAMGNADRDLNFVFGHDSDLAS